MPVCDLALVDSFFRQSCLSCSCAAIAIIDILVNIAETIAKLGPLTHSTKIWFGPQIGRSLSAAVIAFWSRFFSRCGGDWWLDLFCFCAVFHRSVPSVRKIPLIWIQPQRLVSTCVCCHLGQRMSRLVRDSVTEGGFLVANSNADEGFNSYQRFRDCMRDDVMSGMQCSHLST